MSVASGPAQWMLQPARDAGREGIVTVWDHEGLYLGCMGTEVWRTLLVRDKDGLTVNPSEFVSARDASRQFGRLVDRLEAGELAKAVIVDRNTPRAVIVSLAEFVRLDAAEEKR